MSNKSNSIKDFIILADTRQQKDNHIIKYFDKENMLWIRTGLPSADYMAIRYDNQKGFWFDYSILIDTKKDLLELCGNLCKSTEHERIKREIEKARELGCKDFIFLIQDSKIKTIEDVKKWYSPYTKVRGITLFKIMYTMNKKYGVKFCILPKKEIGRKIIDLLK